MCYKLRPHHGLCISFFEGKGYNDEFTIHMRQIIEKFSENPEVQLIWEEDVICLHCPNNGESGCVTAEKVNRYDRAVLQMCGLEIGEKFRWEKLCALVKEQIILKKRMKEICPDCQWANICQKATTIS